MKMLAHSQSEVSEGTIINCFCKAGFEEGVSNEDDDPFSAFKSSIDQLQQCNENLIWKDFTYKDILTADNDIAVMGDKEIVQDLIEVAKEDVQEEDEEVTDETITKTRTDKLCKAIDTLVNFSMFSQNGEIGTTALKAAKLFEKNYASQ